MFPWAVGKRMCDTSIGPDRDMAFAYFIVESLRHLADSVAFARRTALVFLLFLRTRLAQFGYPFR